QGIDGLEVLRQLKQQEDAPVVIMISGHGTIETAVKATKLGAFDFLEKPLTMEKTVLLVRHALEHLRLAQENRQLREQLRTRYRIVGKSIPMKALRQQLALAAPTNGRVLIYGESGTGKELVARALHAGSLRAGQPLVEVNCAAIPDELIESELFGHRRGAFTGATDDKIGKFQQADGGTLFLDEVGDMSLRTQSKVLRVLEEQRIEPLGSNRSIQVDTRVIAATNKNLEEEMAHGRFREDLFYRLNVVPFHVPALRERAEDIPLLADYFLEQFASAYGRRKKELAPDALEVLQSYPWPGNVRELKNMIERLVIMAPQDRIQKRHLPPELSRGRGRAPAMAATLEEARTNSDRQFIQRKLEENRWNVTRTAAAIGVERSHLHRKMRALGISPQRNT
ncbi:MAG: sigma-54-dependent Fis family transcriptional regulator, partial [Acidobacteria bacterium]|nr:sigma-54-dependent Fis family transcriptional regulator [Acidobacteriota bacterium]